MYEFESKVRYSETDRSGVLSLEALLNYFQDCSTFQSEILGVGLEYLKELSLCWVLSSWQIVVHEYPKLCEDIIIGTFPYEFKGFLGYRNFYLNDCQGKQLACASSLWTLVNIDTMKPIYPTEPMIQAYLIEPKLEMDYAPRKITLTKDGVLVQKEGITVTMHQLDTNNHVNNGQYIGLAMNFLPEDFKIGQMRAEYKKPAFLNDTMIPFVYYSTDKIIVSLRDTEGQPYVNVEFTAKI